MTNESQPLTRQTKRVDQLRYGDIVADFNGTDTTFAEVRHAEPITDEPGRVLVLYAGGETTNLRGASEVDLASAEEYAAYKQRVSDAGKRARIRAGLMRLVDALDQGLPLPAYFDIDGSCTPTPEAVREVAKVFDVEPEESLNAGAPQIRARVVLAADELGRREVELDFWHLGNKSAVES